VQRQDAYVSSLAERAMALLMSGEWSLPPEQ
jgi:hypothetical protein